VFTDVRIVDGNGGPPIEHGIIVVEGKTIISVGARSDVPIPPNARRISASGKTALPGLADMHVHLNGGWDGVSSDMLGYKRYMNAFLYAGVTTVMDTGNIEPYILQLRAEISAGRLTGPHIYCVGPLIDGPDSFWPAITSPLVSKDQVPGLVRRLSGEKVDFIKLYAGLSDALVQAMSTEAQKYNLRTIIDQHARNGSIDLMQEGIAGYAHLPPYAMSDDAIAVAQAHHIFFITTLSLYESFSRRRFQDLSFLNDPLIADATPAFALKSLREEFGAAAANQQPPTRLVGRLHDAERNVRRLKDAGLLIAAGTDAPYPGDFQGEGLHRELELLVEAGFTPLEAITTATRNAALIVNAGELWGTLTPGKRADIVIVDGKPDQNIHDTRRIAIVVREGVVLDRSKLRSNPATDPGYLPLGGFASSGS
jgi:hypothetical protein